MYHSNIIYAHASLSLVLQFPLPVTIVNDNL
jgi:hypothetical protein